MNAMVLAAGLGTRLRPITYSVPKPMVPVLNRPVMEHIVRLLEGHGFNQIVANLHWFPETITDHFEGGSRFGVNLEYSREEQLLGTAGGVLKAREFLGDSFLVISGDALTDIDLTAMKAFHDSHDGVATLATKKVKDASEFGVIITGGDGRIQGFQEKPEPAEALSDLANCGIYMFDREIFDFFPGPGESNLAEPGQPEGFADWALDVFPALMESGRPFYSYEFDSYWNDVGTVSEFLQGSFDGLTRAVELAIEEPEVSPGIWIDEGVSTEGVRIEGPVLIAEGCEIAPGAELTGPLVLGRNCKMGEGVRLKEAILLDDAEVPAGSFAVGGVLGR
ncbi:MAG: NDP-sugar synthase [Solirubrobacterales bacterium]|nr:NDP-sugar synthase [Solirubrobacterales bacterium]